MFSWTDVSSKGAFIYFLHAELDLKDKIINHNREDIELLKKKPIENEKEISNLKKKIKEKDAQKKRSSSISIQKKEIPDEKTFSRNPNLHPDKHHNNSSTTKAYTDKPHVTKLGHANMLSLSTKKFNC